MVFVINLVVNHVLCQPCAQLVYTRREPAFFVGVSPIIEHEGLSFVVTDIAESD